MSSFALEGPAGGALAIGQGIGQALKAVAMGGQVRRQAEQDAALKQSTMYANNMRGNQLGAEAALLEHKLGLQRDPLKAALTENQIPLNLQSEAQSFIDTGRFSGAYEAPPDGMGPVLPAPISPEKRDLIARSMTLYNRTGMAGGNVENMAKAQTEMQTQRIREQALANVGDLDRMNRLNALAKEGQAYMPFDAVGTTGVSMNKATGQGAGMDLLRKLLEGKTNSEITENRAQANSSNASAGKYSAEAARVASGLAKPVTVVDDETGHATIIALPTRGDPRTIGVAPAKGTGVDATNAKARNAVVTSVERELGSMATDEEIAAEVDRRLARRGANKSPAPGPSAPKIPSQSGQYKSADEVKAAYRSGKMSREDAKAILQSDFRMK